MRAPFSSLIPEPQAGPEIAETSVPATKAILSDVFEAANDPECIGFGAGCASPELFPNRSLNLILRRIVNRDPMHSARYFFPPGAENLRRQIARRALDMQCRLSPRDVTITGGALESVYLSLRATTKPGEAVAVESPTYLGVLGCATAMGLELIEIPAHPQEGMDLNRLEHSIRKHRIKACVVMTNCHNPLGYILPDQYKRSLADLAARHNVAVIEDEGLCRPAISWTAAAPGEIFRSQGTGFVMFVVFENPGAWISCWVACGGTLPGRSGAPEISIYSGGAIAAADGNCGVSGIRRV